MEEISLPVSDGTNMQAYVGHPKSKPLGGLVVLQEAFGVNQHIKDLADQFAKEGYLAVAPELYHRTAPAGFTAAYTEFASVGAHYSAITEKGMQQDVQACYDWLVKSHQLQSVAAIGYCLGGRVAFVANGSVPLSCAICYYGGGIATNHLHLAESQKSPALFFWGGLDKHITSEHVQSTNQAMKKAGKKFTCVEISDADHAFACNERASYNAVASRQALALSLQFLKDYNSVR